MPVRCLGGARDSPHVISIGDELAATEEIPQRVRTVSDQNLQPLILVSTSMMLYTSLTEVTTTQTIFLHYLCHSFELCSRSSSIRTSRRKPQWTPTSSQDQRGTDIDVALWSG